MSKRTYNQACPLAFTLDLIGERWMLLVVRDLLLGPLRFSDLLERLPGIGRNLLAARLRRLLAEGLVERRELAPPAGSTVYELTEKGRGLEPGLLALSAWGIRYGLAEGRLTGHMEPDLVGLGLQMSIVPERAAGEPAVYELDVGGTALHVRVGGGHADLRRGPATQPSVRLRAEIPFFLAAMQARTVDLEAARARGALVVEGDAARAPEFFALFGIAAR